ncbi:Alpha-L-arabinofuranosidase 1 [Sesamum angolense]|uniref:Alpha-L-arabinofuranosidase 1 n=1 Tax=Sesamum angolense TaxID=2727404 RepID=A0AAE1X3Z8_9LAMI|nr:Alpha-L-arabinofuranosidase 1 [Sesamum angolense]
MGAITLLHSILLFFFILLSALYQSSATGIGANQTILLFVNASEASAKKIPETLFGIFFEEINHAGAGGLWAELVNNRGFEAGGPNTPSNIEPWSVIGDESSLFVSTDRSSCFDRNKIALRMEVLCGHEGTMCPASGVGIYNPGFWGMVQVLLFQSSRGLVTRLPIGPKFVLQNIEQGKTYKLVLYARSLGPINVSVSLIGSTGLQLASTNIVASDVSNWTKLEAVLQAKGTDANSRLQLTTTRKGVVWFDQVSLMPTDTYKGHGFRNDLFEMVKNMRPAFIRFPGGCFVEGEWLRNAFRWKETIGPWEERPGHFGDVWHYWTDDGLGHFEFLQLAEDLGALPIWVFNNGVSHNDEVDTSSISPFLQEILDGIEFARGDRDSKWGSVRAAMGHPEPFDLRYVAVGNEDCGKKNYLGNYLKFYSAIKSAYPDIKIISNCDGSSQPLDHPADLYDYHAFVSEYAVTGNDAGKGSLLAALAEAGFLIGLEKNWLGVPGSILGLHNVKTMGEITRDRSEDENRLNYCLDEECYYPVREISFHLLEIENIPVAVEEIRILRENIYLNLQNYGRYMAGEIELREISNRNVIHSNIDRGLEVKLITILLGRPKTELTASNVIWMKNSCSKCPKDMCTIPVIRRV